MDGKHLVFVEVKYRKNGSYGNPLAAVNLKKQQTLGKVAEYYLLTHKCTVNTPCRFDVVGILGRGKGAVGPGCVSAIRYTTMVEEMAYEDPLA